jgi:hypothetical protein
MTGEILLIAGGFLIGFGVRGLIQNFIESRIKYHQDQIKKNEDQK